MMKKRLSILPIFLLTGCSFTPTINNNDLVLIDITDPLSTTSKVSSQYPDEIAGEGLTQLFDDSKSSKYLSKQSSTWVQFDYGAPISVKKYRLTSAQDAPMRDPRNWTLRGSNNLTDWQTLQTISDFKFAQRGFTAEFELDNESSYQFYRLEMTQRGKTQWGDNYLQLADLQLLAPTKLPVVDFLVSKQIVKPNENVQLQSNTLNKPTSYVWRANKTILAKNTPSPTVSFAEPGSYNLSLKAINNFGSDTLTKHNEIKVLDKSKPWQGFKTPTVKLNFIDKKSPGYHRLIALFPDLSQTIDDVTHQLVKKLYKNFAEVPEFRQVEFKLEWMDTLAYRSGDETNMVIAFSSKYITEKLKDQPDEVVKYELLGVLWHELTHGYQLFPANTSYASDDTHAFIEGMADLIRIEAGYHKTRSPKTSQTWLGGYTNTGFFLKWLSDNKVDDFAYRFNQTAKNIEPWSFQTAIESLTDEPLSSLWEQYQQSLITAQ